MLAAGAIAPAAADAHAQGTTPEADDGNQGTTMMFVQTYRSGSVARAERNVNRYTLTLGHGQGQTVYFADRPECLVGISATEQNPPIAALVVESAPGESNVAVVELYSPVYDPETHGVTYEIEVLANW